jgi:hypothetical protein
VLREGGMSAPDGRLACGRTGRGLWACVYILGDKVVFGLSLIEFYLACTLTACLLY